jgi:small subunit ribosomal protein S4
MPIRSRKKYSRPKKRFDKERIEEENILREKYGLKNKREIWVADTSIKKIRGLAKALITKSEDEKNRFIERLNKKGFEVKSIADALALDKENWLKRRLQTIVFEKKIAKTPKQARQLIVHKKILIGNRIINIPSYQVSLSEGSLVEISLKPKKNKTVKKEIEESIEEKNGEFTEEKDEVSEEGEAEE